MWNVEHDHVPSIGELTPDHCRVSVVGKVLQKTCTLNTSPGSYSGPFYKILIGDETDVLYVFLYLDPKPPERPCPEFRQMMEETAESIRIGQVYKFSGRIREYNADYTATHQNGVELQFDEVSPADHEDIANCQRHVPFLFKNAEQINSSCAEVAVDVLGTVLRLDNADTQEENLRNFVTLQVLGGQFHCNVWEANAQIFQSVNVPIKVAIQGAKTTDWNGRRNLHIGNTARVYMVNTDEEKTILHSDNADFFFNTFAEVM